MADETKSADLGSYMESELLQSAACGNVEAVVSGLRKGQATEGAPITPLFVACATGQTKVAQAIISEFRDDARALSVQFAPCGAPVGSAPFVTDAALTSRAKRLLRGEGEGGAGAVGLRLRCTQMGLFKAHSIVQLSSWGVLVVEEVKASYRWITHNAINDSEHVFEIGQPLPLPLAVARNTPLLAAAAGGLDRLVFDMLDAGANPHVTDERGNTVLLVACWARHEELACALLDDERVNVRRPCAGGLDALGAATLAGCTAVVARMLADDRFNPDRKCPDGSTPLQFACLKGHTDIVKLMMAHPRIDARRTDVHGVSPLHCAVGGGFVDVVALLIEDGRSDVAASTKLGTSAFKMAARAGNVEILKLLAADSRVSKSLPNNNGATPAYAAAQLGRLEALKFLATLDDVDLRQPNKTGSTPLSIAAHKGHLDVVAFLLAHPRCVPDDDALDDAFDLMRVRSMRRDEWEPLVDRERAWRRRVPVIKVAVHALRLRGAAEPEGGSPVLSSDLPLIATADSAQDRLQVMATVARVTHLLQTVVSFI